MMAGKLLFKLAFLAALAAIAAGTNANVAMKSPHKSPSEVPTMRNTKKTALDGGQSGRYSASWESLDTRPLPNWYDEAKFGIFIHWVCKNF